MHYMQDRPAYNHLGYTQDSNLLNLKPNPLTLTITLVRSLIRANQAPCGLQSCKNRPAPFPGRMSKKVTKPGSACPVS